MLEEVKHYYGKVLKTSADLQTNACCTGEQAPPSIREVLNQMVPEVVERYYGCGLVVPAQLDVAESHIDEHAKRFGYAKSNVSFLQGELEHLDELDLEPCSFDLIVSNCVINLCQDKGRVLKNAYHLLK